VTIDQVPTTYPATLTDQFYVVVYGYTIGRPWPPMDQVDDVYDAHPVIQRSTTTTSTSSSTETTDTPTHQGSQDKQKKITVTPVSHGDQASRPVYLYCNVGESSIVGTQITNFLRDLPYKDDPIRWEPQHVQYHRVRGDTVEILEVQVAETSGNLLTLNPAGETQVTFISRHESHRVGQRSDQRVSEQHPQCVQGTPARPLGIEGERMESGAGVHVYPRRRFGLDETSG